MPALLRHDGPLIHVDVAPDALHPLNLGQSGSDEGQALSGAALKY